MNCIDIIIIITLTFSSSFLKASEKKTTGDRTKIKIEKNNDNNNNNFTRVDCQCSQDNENNKTFGPINQAGRDFLSSLGHRLSLVSDDPRESSFLFQRLSVSIQRFDSVCFCNSFGNPPAQLFDQPRRT